VYTRNLREIIKERTAEVVRQKDEIEEKNKEITDSIHYASRIQSAILPPADNLESNVSDHFILYMPRDIVSGDFYWINSDKNKLITVAADCTGHGVPGAFMSMLGVAFLNEIVKKNDQTRADEILNQLRVSIIKSLRQTGKEGENKDGMDIALCVYDLEKMKLQFAGANNPLYHIRNEELLVYKADKMPIGIHSRVNENFTLQEIDLIKGDIFYTFSDGYIDQFGGPEEKKFLSKQFREFLLTIHKENLKTQQQLLKEKIIDWMSNTTQIDDILVMGIKI
jgi:serine phosphatase RsbU (regulator of sigma subunit)